MPGYAARMAKARVAIDRAREKGIPVIFIQEVHRPDLVDFGRELDGEEEIHCLEDNPKTEIAVEQMGFRPNDYLIKKRRYSAFFGTDLEILLRGLKVETLLLCGGLTNVCVHYSFVAGSSEAAHEAAHEAALQAMEYLQKGARRSLSKVLAAMEAAARPPPPLPPSPLGLGKGRASSGCCPARSRSRSPGWAADSAPTGS